MSGKKEKIQSLKKKHFFWAVPQNIFGIIHWSLVQQSRRRMPMLLTSTLIVDRLDCLESSSSTSLMSSLFWTTRFAKLRADGERERDRVRAIDVRLAIQIIITGLIESSKSYYLYIVIRCWKWMYRNYLLESIHNDEQEKIFHVDSYELFHARDKIRARC